MKLIMELLNTLHIVPRSLKTGSLMDRVLIRVASMLTSIGPIVASLTRAN